jgi:GNAT superfamily N-acetyltransferase
MNENEVSARKVNLPLDRDAILEFHCQINYECDTPYARRISYEDYREKWLSSSQPEAFLTHLTQTMLDERTVAEIWEMGGSPVGYLWMIFTYLPDYDLTIAELMDVAVVSKFQRRGIGTKMIQRAEQHARRMGAALFRSETGIENLASQKLHVRAEFKPYRICYEKVLS